MILDYLFTLLHLIIIGFNLLGWIWRSTRKLHLIFVLLTAASWLLLGIWYGIGYCPITDWQWQIKETLGETNLPNSFIKYFVDKLTRSDISSDLIDAVTAIFFAIAAALSVYLNFFKKNQQKHRPN
ncbi:DUF2784 domain-containing protein [Pedobacter ginsengisoli]|uniref:DUF2784 domain-containing protein n=1 Tax=Pedobacter ginsengisoli TaxID=363852 RepID=UPI00254E6621|nr:DUF2784 domain-containing protein [Pedobacter ginsengisoli]